LQPCKPEMGQPIIPPDQMIMEVKTLGGMPLWLARIFSENGIFPTAFSKYGTCYTHYLLNPLRTERKVA